MALPTSGTITLDEIHVEAGGTTNTTATINDADIRALIGKAAGVTMSFDEWYGASAAVTINLTIGANTNNYNIQNSRGGTYVAGITTVNLTINSGVTVGSTSTGTYALETGSSWASGDVINIINNGTVKGRGGNGGNGGSVVFNSSAPAGAAGGKGKKQKSLSKWTKEEWGTKSGKPSTQGKKATGERYLPKKARQALSSSEYAKTTAAKRRGTAKGKQFVKQPKAIAKKTAKYRKAAKGGLIGTHNRLY